MANSKDIQRVASEIAASSKISPTAAGRPEGAQTDPNLIDAINQVFGLFRANYHNQYYSAFGDKPESVGLAKKLWLSKLENLPTLHKMLTACRSESLPVKLPAVRTAYLEACRKPAPKIDQEWSHPIVYLAGRDTGWHLLANEIEIKALPAFTEVYQRYCDQLIDGQQFVIDRIEPSVLLEERPSSKDFSQKEIKKLKKLLS